MRSRPDGEACEGMALSKPFAATCWSGCGSTATGASRAATCAMRPGSSGRCWRPRSKATSSPTSRSATNRSIARIRDTTSRHDAQDAVRKPDPRSAHRAAPAPDEAALAELAQSVDRAARARLGRSLSIRQVDAGSCNGCELEIHALSNAFYDLERFGLRFVASPRHADVLMVTGPVTKNMREALLAHLQRDARSEMGGRDRRLRRRRRRFCRQLCSGGRRQGRGTGRLAHPRLSAVAERTLKGTDRVVGPCRRKARGPCKSRLMVIPTIISPNSASLLWDQPETAWPSPLMCDDKRSLTSRIK